MAAQTITGLVTKAGVMAKTVTMTVEKRLVHPKLFKVRFVHYLFPRFFSLSLSYLLSLSSLPFSLLSKTYVRHQKYLVHDESQVLSVGDRIIAQACRPLSARKRFTLSSLVGGANAGEQRRAAKERMMGAEEREKLRIEKVVKEEVGRRNSGNTNNIKERSR